MDNNQEEQVILKGDDGAELVCRVLSVFEFQDQEYALLLNTGEAGAPPNDDPETVLMRVKTQNDQAVFSTIEDDEEFNRVTEFVNELIAEMDDQEEVDEENVQ